ncbi:hypothetical protein M3J09_011994 [Ascochyta lentis]
MDNAVIWSRKRRFLWAMPAVYTVVTGQGRAPSTQTRLTRTSTGVHTVAIVVNVTGTLQSGLLSLPPSHVRKSSRTPFTSSSRSLATNGQHL